MTRVLVVLEDANQLLEDLNQTAYEYYIEAIYPGFIQANYELYQTTCPGAWAVLQDIQFEAILLFVEKEESCCWTVARRIREEWTLSFSPPLIFMVFYWDSKLLLPDYYVQPHYASLYDSLAEGSRWNGVGLAIQLNLTLTRRSFDPQLFEQQVAALFPSSQHQWTWSFENFLTHHILLRLSLQTEGTEQPYKLVWTRDKSVHILDHWDKFIELIQDSKMSLSNDLGAIMAILSYFQEKNILTSVRPPDRLIPNWDLPLLAEDQKSVPAPTYSLLVPASKVPLLAKYAEIVRHPRLWVGEKEQQARFWTVELKTDNLEEWLLTQRAGKLQVQSWLREEGFVFELEACLNYREISNCLDIHIIRITEPFVTPSND